MHAEILISSIQHELVKKESYKVSQTFVVVHMSYLRGLY